MRAGGAAGGARGLLRAGGAAADAAAVTALAVVVGWYVRDKLFGGIVSAHDVYAYYFPNMMYAARQLREGAGGLLWNPLQNCGEPFLANLVHGLYYPPNWLFALLQRDRALVAAHLIGAAIAALGGYAFFRQLGARPLVGLAAALVFLIAPVTLQMVTWSPIHIGSYCWLPVALFCGERLLAAPTLRNTFVLAAVLTVALLPGYPQMTLFIYVLLALQMSCRLAMPGARARGRTLGAFALAAALPLALGAFALLPFAEFWRESIRSRPLTIEEFVAATNFAPFVIRRVLTGPGRLHIAALLGAAALFHRDLRRQAIFLFLTGALVISASLGVDGPLGWVYLNVAGMTMFRGPDRFLWLSDLCCAGLVAVGVEALARMLGALRPHGRWVLGALRLPAIALLAAAATWGMLGWNHPFQNIEPSSDMLWRRASAFHLLRSALTPQNRIYLTHRNPIQTGFTLMHKTASLFQVPSIFDYEPMTERRYAEYFVTMRGGSPMTKLDDFLLGHYLGGWIGWRFSWPLLNLTAARYLVFDAAGKPPPPRPWLRPWRSRRFGGLRVYENTAALPRAFFVGGVEVVANPARLLQRLAGGSVATERVALVEAPPASGFLGSTEPAKAAVRFVVDRPERVELDVDAPRRGFVFLADTFYPGWTAEVNGRSVPVQRANYTFRLVEVPEGRSRVVYRFRPWSLAAGALISLLTLAGMMVALRVARAANGGAR